jgi:hypothetical protein
MAKLPEKQTKRKRRKSIKKILLEVYNRKTMSEVEIIDAKYNSMGELKRMLDKLGKSISELEKLKDNML